MWYACMSIIARFPLFRHDLIRFGLMRHRINITNKRKKMVPLSNITLLLIKSLPLWISLGWTYWVINHRHQYTLCYSFMNLNLIPVIRLSILFILQYLIIHGCILQTKSVTIPVMLKKLQSCFLLPAKKNRVGM